MTQGYGPEMYVLPRGARGKYEIIAHYYASDANRQSARTKVQATVVRGWGTKAEKVTDTTVTLAVGKNEHPIATVVLD